MNKEQFATLAKQYNAISATIDRFEDRFDSMLADNSFNWYDASYPVFEIRKDGQTEVVFIWYKENQSTDPRCNDYLDENCFVFLDYNDFLDFCCEIRTESEDDDNK